MGGLTTAARTTAALTSGRTSATAGAWTSTRLLHVEDNEADAVLFQEYIRNVVPGVEFHTVARLEDLTQDGIDSDCAILDLSLPGARGLEALHVLRGLSEDLPIIVLTGTEDLDLAVEALRHGADDYLVKNEVSGALLRRAIRYAIERRRLRLDVILEAIATATATAQALNAEESLRVVQAQAVIAEAALSAAHTETRAAEAALARQVDSHDAVTATPSGGLADRRDELRTFHEVAVGVHERTGDYSLRCGDCDWVGATSSESHHDWRARKLDVELFDHVDFGGLLAPCEPLPPAGGAISGLAAVSEVAAMSGVAGSTVFGPAMAAVGRASQRVDPDGLEPPTSAL